MEHSENRHIEDATAPMDASSETRVLDAPVVAADETAEMPPVKATSADAAHAGKASDTAGAPDTRAVTSQNAAQPRSVTRVVATVCILFVALLFVGSFAVSALTPEEQQSDFWIASQRAHHDGMKKSDDINIVKDIAAANDIDQSQNTSASDDGQNGNADSGRPGGSDASDNGNAGSGGSGDDQGANENAGSGGGNDNGGDSGGDNGNTGSGGGDGGGSDGDSGGNGDGTSGETGHGGSSEAEEEAPAA